jgi:hypothetical protein
MVSVLDKCATTVFKHGKLTKSKEGDGIDKSQMKDKLVKEYYCRVWQILKTELSLKNNITATTT